LLLHVVLDSVLCSLAEVVLGLVFGPLLAITGQAGQSAADSSYHAVRDARGEISGLALGLLLLTGYVLLASGLF
jgi:hypothetical protein